jgi:hypothetical protein
MAVISFTDDDADAVWVRNAVLRMILSRAMARLTDPGDLEELELSKLVGALSFGSLDGGKRARLLEAVFEAAKSLKAEIAAGAPVEEPVRAGIDDKLTEVLALLGQFRE